MGHSNINENQLKQEFQRIDTNHGGYILFDEVCSFLFSVFPTNIFCLILVLHIHGKEKNPLNNPIILMKTRICQLYLIRNVNSFFSLLYLCVLCV